MLSKKNAITTIVSTAVVLSFTVVSAASALTTSCVGAPSASGITWTASSSGGVAPITFLWGNGSTSSVQTVALAPGTYSMTLQATDASSTIATSTCAATVAQPAPTVSATSTGTTDDMLTQIQNLLNQIANLKAQVAALVQAHVAALVHAHNDLQHQALRLIGTLHRGMSGEEVRKLQEVLATDQDVLPREDVTGFFGPLTEEAVKRFQRHFGIDTLGMVGPHTLEKINELLQEHNVMDDDDFQDGEIGDIGTSDDGEHDDIDSDNREHTDNGDIHDATSSHSSSHDKGDHGHNRED